MRVAASKWRYLCAMAGVISLASACAGGVEHLAPSPTATSTPARTSTEMQSAVPLDAIVEEWSGASHGAVAAGVFIDDDSWVAAAGRDTETPITPDQPWLTASLAKLFTATAVMQLVEHGVVDLDGPVDDYVDLPVPARLTVRHLLEHRSSLPTGLDVDDCDFEGSMAMLERVVDQQLGTPGGAPAYANLNYALLGVLIADVTDEDVGVAIRDMLFDPLGMDATYFYVTQPGPDAWHVDERQCGPLLDREIGGPVGAAATTLADTGVLLRALFDGDLVDGATLEQMLTFDSEVFGYQFGLGIAEIIDADHPGRVLLGFGGADGAGYETRAAYEPDTDRIYVVASATGDRLWALVDWADAALAGDARD